MLISFRNTDKVNRRQALTWFGTLVAIPAFGAADFWNRKPPSDWSSEEVGQLMSRSPWAKEVNAEFMSDTDYTTGSAAGPTIGQGGAIGAPGVGGSSTYELGRGGRDTSGGTKHREPVTVRWESAQPIRDGLGLPLSADLKNRYVISVSGLPIGIMDRRRRANSPDEQPPDQSPAARQRRMLDALQGSATLQAKGLEPAQAGAVEPAPRTPGTYLFGFSKDLLPLDSGSKEILFTLQTAMMAVRAKFEPRTMVYRGHLAL